MKKGYKKKYKKSKRKFTKKFKRTGKKSSSFKKRFSVLLHQPPKQKEFLTKQTQFQLKKHFGGIWILL